jgi:hypothetical protein
MFHIIKNLFGGVMVSMVASSEAQVVRIKQTTNTIVIYCFSTKDVALRSKNKDWRNRNHVDVTEWSDMSTRILLFQ